MAIVNKFFILFDCYAIGTLMQSPWKNLQMKFVQILKYFKLLSSSWRNSVMTSRDNEEHIYTWGSARIDVSDQP